jgi:capsular exopolysaccharide synthesis family protein
MSRIHEALKKAVEERHSSQAADIMTLSVEAAHMEGIAENGTVAEAIGTSARTTRSVPAPPPIANLGFDALVARCARREWRPKVETNVFSNPVATACGAEQFRTLRSRLYQIRGNQPNYMLLVTSSLPDEGKTFVAHNLARAIVQKAQQRVLIIDADLRYPQMHLALGAPLAPGLTDYLRGQADEMAAIQYDNHENLCFMPGGNQVTNPSELLSNGRLKFLLDRVTAIFDWVIVDSSPCLLVADASMVAGFSNGVLFVVRAGSTSVDAAQKVCQQLRTKNIVGVVLNGAEKSDLYDSHYEGYGYGDPTDAPIPRLRPHVSSPGPRDKR